MRPLERIRILDLTRLLPGAYATRLLADLGAEVIKIEDPQGGDSMRYLAVDARLKPSASTAPANVYFEQLNRGKQSVRLDLRSPDAAAVLDALAQRADVIVDSFRPSTARRLGIDAEVLRSRHPRLICVSINGFGQTGSDADRAAHDINYEALAGLLRPPQLPEALIGDIGAAMQAAIGILAALVERERSGQGAIVDISIYGAARAWAMFPTTLDLASACYTLYETADGEWLALGALEQKFWTRFCDRIGRPDLAPLQHAQGDEGARVLREVRDVMKARTRDEWLALFANDDVCLTRVNPPADVEPPSGDGRRAPALGADTDRILEEAGISDGRRAALRAAGVI